jgi:hypothetical protein
VKRSLRDTRPRRGTAVDGEASTSTPFHKRSWFVGLTAAIGLVSVVLGIATGFFGIIDRFIKPKKLPQNTEIVFDRSTGMNDPFEGSTKKIEAAAQAVELLLKDSVLEQSNLALREFGGSCSDKSTPLSIPFEPKHHDTVIEAVKSLKLQGKATLNSAVLHAVNDFSDPERFDGVEKKIIVIVGNEDACEASGGPSLENIRSVLEQKEIKLNFHFIGVGLNNRAKKELFELADITKGTAHITDDLKQLTAEIQGLWELIPRAVKSVTDILQESDNNLIPVITAIQKDDYVTADENYTKANLRFIESNAEFQELNNIYKVDQYVDIYNAATSVREGQRQLISVAGKILQAHKDGHGTVSEIKDEFDRARADYNAKQAEFSEKIGRFHSFSARH